jgi:hypothetical protein
MANYVWLKISRGAVTYLNFSSIEYFATLLLPQIIQKLVQAGKNNLPVKKARKAYTTRIFSFYF